MTAHELARLLLAGPDVPVRVLDENVKVMNEIPAMSVNRWDEPRRVTISGWTE